MKLRLTTCGLAAAAAATTMVSAGEIEQNLQDAMDAAAPGEIISSLVYLEHQLDTKPLIEELTAMKAPLSVRHNVIVTSLIDTAQVSQVDLLAELNALQNKGMVEQFTPFWIANLIRVDATAETLTQLAEHPDVDIMYFNQPIEGIKPVEGPGEGEVDPPAFAGGPEPGVIAVRAPEVWADFGIDGTGVLVSTLDTGVDGNHPALASRWRGLDPAYAGNPQWAFFDPVTNQTFPFDSGSHGTHTMGSVLGGLPGDQVGVAPGSEWIHCAVIDRAGISQTVADAILSFQWVTDPDGNPNTHFDVPDTCSNSWGLVTSHGYPECDETFWVWIDNSEAAGIVQLFSAGNEGFSGLRRPADRATDEYRSVAVAAVDGNNGSFPIAGFSSRGPTNCTPNGTSAIKPDISAPGVSVRSSVPGGYSNFSGTSMASPHVNGVVALMRQANPDLAPEQIKDIIYSTAMDLGASGEDNNYGYGMIDAYLCVTEALSTVSLTFSFPNGRPEYIDPLGNETIMVEVGGNADQDPSTATLHYRVGLTFEEVAMTEMSPGLYSATFPALPCGASVDYYFSIATLEGETVTNPFNAPDSVYNGEVFTGLIIDFEDDFESDTGWTVTGNAADGQWERGTPAGGGDRGDPAIDGDGSGQCYVTDNEDGNSDVDGGSTTLTSPIMDASDPEISVVYSRWYSNTFGADPENDIFTVEVSDDGGSSWVTLEVVGPAGSEVNGGWFTKNFVVADIPGITNTNQFRIRFTASDLNAGSVVEAGVDGVQLSKLYCEELEPCPTDLDGNGSTDVDDLLALLANWGTDGQGADIADPDNIVNVDDLLGVLGAWGDCE